MAGTQDAKTFRPLQLMHCHLEREKNSMRTSSIYLVLICSSERLFSATSELFQLQFSHDELTLETLKPPLTFHLSCSSLHESRALLPPSTHSRSCPVQKKRKAPSKAGACVTVASLRKKNTRTYSDPIKRTCRF